MFVAVGSSLRSLINFKLPILIRHYPQSYLNAQNKIMKLILLTTISLVAFAGNSILCKIALGENEIDAGSFTSIRLLSGIVALILIYKLSRKEKESTSKGSWKASFMLFIYAVSFSYAYITLETGVGALILFASVQMTILGISFISGKKIYAIEWLGVSAAFLGFIYLVFPSLSTPSLSGFILMSISGGAWGLYTLLGKNSRNPLSDTTFNFIRTLPLLLILILFTVGSSSISLKGVVLAVLAGSLTSGVGYTIWYIAINDLSAVQASVVQLIVPVIATVGGAMFIGEEITVRLMVSSIIILFGILMVTLGRYYYDIYYLKKV